MKKCVLAVALLATIGVVCGNDKRYDHIDVDQVLQSDRLLMKYHECLVSDNDDACTPGGKELKSFLPDALKTGCEQCTEKQTAKAEKVIRFLVSEKPDLWKSLADKYDPDGTYRQMHNEGMDWIFT